MKTSNSTSKAFLKVLCALLMLLLAYISLSSCASHKDVPIVMTNTITDVQKEIVEKHDSIYVRDSIYEYLEARNDTVVKYKYVYKTKYVDKPYKEYVYINKSDTINVPYPVERKLSWWEQTKIRYGGYALCSGFAFIIIIVGFMVRRIKKK